MWIERFRNLSTSTRVASLATVAAVAVWSAVWITPDPDSDSDSDKNMDEPAAVAEQADPPSEKPAEKAAVEPPAASVQPAQPAQPSSAAPQPPAEPKTAAPVQADKPSLRDALASDNAGERIDALRTLAELRRVDVLPELTSLDVARDPELAPTVFQVTGRLAQHADAAQRTAAVAQLSRWLESESAREGADARGNVSVLVETLADFRAPEAERALIDVLQSTEQPLHVQTLAVEGLGKLGTPAAQAALTQFRAQLGQSERSGFERELQKEAEQAADRALARLAR